MDARWRYVGSSFRGERRGFAELPACGMNADDHAYRLHTIFAARKVLSWMSITLRSGSW